MDTIKIITFNQLMYHLGRGEVATFKGADFYGFLEQDGNEYQFLMQHLESTPDKPKNETWATKEKRNVQNMFDHLKKQGIPVLVIPGSEIKKVGN